MPTFTAIALDRLIEPGSAKTEASVRTCPDATLERKSSTPNTSSDTVPNTSNCKFEKSASLPNSMCNSKNVSPTAVANREHHWTQISPALYATPKPTPLPDSPSSFPPSPYIINHKRRGPRLLKTFSQNDVAIRNQTPNEEKVDENVKYSEKEVDPSVGNESLAPAPVTESPKGDVAPIAIISEKDGVFHDEVHINDFANSSAVQNGTLKSITFNMQQDGEADDFFEPPESMSVTSNADSECNYGIERSANVSTPLVEFYDAWEELSSGSGPQPSLVDLEAEMREIRLSLLMEIEKRKQAEEELNTLRTQWWKIREKLSVVGLSIPLDLLTVSEAEQQNDPAEEISQQLFVARFVSNSIGRGIAKAEVEMEMEAQMELKNFEIVRLLDRLHYYEAVNREMSQRNQETIEATRRLRQRKKRRQRLIWGSIAGAVTLGTAFLAWSYLPSGKGSYSSNHSNAPEGNQASEQ